MIKTILLHIGVHKTASTTIQNTLHRERVKLMEEGVLYPVFKVGNTAISNHSIPFYSLFMLKPETYHFNVSQDFTTPQAIQQLHQNYHIQMEEQLSAFEGETLIISGEDISHLNKHELENLKSFLLENTSRDANIMIVMVCRHPVSRFRSALQASICNFGMTMGKATDYHLSRSGLYRNLLNQLSGVFGRENITVLKYEDLVLHKFGPAGALLEMVDGSLPENIKPEIFRDNQTRTYETVLLLNAINQTFPQTSGYELHPERMIALNTLFEGMPGQKFMLPIGLSGKVWQAYAEDVNWLCREFSLPEYSFLNEDLKPDFLVWSSETLDFIDGVIPNLPTADRNTVIRFLNEMKSQQYGIRTKIISKENIEVLINKIHDRNLTYLSGKRLQSIASTCSEIEKAEIPGVFIEAGCALGGSSILIASVKNRHRKLFIYDVFGMIPPPSDNDPEEVHRRYNIISDGKSNGIGGDKYYGYVDNLLEVVQSNFSTFGIDPKTHSVSLVKGLIRATMQIDEPVAFAHIDVDWYDSVAFCLQTIFPKLSTGGSIIVDDYFDWEGCRMATDEFLLQVNGHFVADGSNGSLKITRINAEKSVMDGNSKDLFNYNEIIIEDFLKKYPGQEVVYCANPGNAGDAIMAHATFQLFEKLNIRPQVIGYKDVVKDKVVFYSGGGNLVEGKYRHAFHFINNNYRQNREIILLPHTVHGYDDLLLSAKNLTIICREKISYQYLAAAGFPPERLFLAHDMAFLLPETEFQDFHQKGLGVANCFRTDMESTGLFVIPADNVDISLSWNGELWHRPDFAKNVTHSLACYLSAFETVKTDRLHIAILAGILGKKVVLYPNNYYKIKAVYTYSMKDVFPNVTFIEINQPAAPSYESQTNVIQDNIDFLKKTLREKDEQIAGLTTTAQILDEVLLSRSWKITKPLRKLMALFKRK